MFVSKICSSGWRLSPFTSLSLLLPDVSLSSLPELLPSCNARRVSGCARRQAGGHHNGSRSRRLLRIIAKAKFVREKDRTRDHGHGARAFLGRRCLLQLVLNGSSRCRISLELSTKHQCFRISQHVLTHNKLAKGVSRKIHKGLSHNVAIHTLFVTCDLQFVSYHERKFAFIS